MGCQPVFLSSLCHSLAEKTEERLGASSSDTLSGLVSKRSIQLGITAGLLGTAIIVLKGLLIAQLIGVLLLALGLTWVSITTISALRRKQLTNDPGRWLCLRAAEMKRWTEYSSVKKSASELTLKAGEGIVTEGKVSQELALSERPVTELNLVTEFKRFVGELRTWHYPVLIAIDGLDKVDSVDDVRRLLRRIKAIFDSDAVVILAIKDEAVIHLGDSDEVRGSFAEIHKVPPVGRDEVRAWAANVLGVDCSDTLWALTGGNLRELCDLLEGCLTSSDSDKPTAGEWIDKATEIAKANFEDALVSDPTVGEQQRSSAFAWARRHLFSNLESSEEKASSLLGGWDPAWADPQLWPSAVAEYWRGLLVRDMLRSVLREEVARQPVDNPNLESLHHAFRLSHRSAGIALQTAPVTNSAVQTILDELPRRQQRPPPMVESSNAVPTAGTAPAPHNLAPAS